jgi:uncharacterized membrane protein
MSIADRFGCTREHPAASGVQVASTRSVAMEDPNPRSTASIMGHPIHPMLIPFPIAFLIGAFLSDIGYCLFRDVFWSTGSAYLLGAALLFGALAAVAGLTDFAGDRRIRALGAAWRHMIGNVVAVLLSAVNLVLRLGGGEDAVLPVGIAISALVVLILAYTGWQGGEMVFRHRVGVAADR